MSKYIGRPSRVKDVVGVAVFAATAFLYSFQMTHRSPSEACASCEQGAADAAPAAAPTDAAPPAETLL